MRWTFDQNRFYYENRTPRSLPHKTKVSISCPGPIHHRNDRIPSATAWLDSGGFHCNGCQEKGSMVDFEMLYCGCDWRQAVANIIALVGPGQVLTPQENAAEQRRYEQRTAARRRVWQLFGESCARLHGMYKLQNSLAPRLMFMENSPEAEAITAEFHRLLDDIRALERALLTVAGGPALADYLDRDLPPLPRAEPFELLDPSLFF